MQGDGNWIGSHTEVRAWLCGGAEGEGAGAFLGKVLRTILECTGNISLNQ